MPFTAAAMAGACALETERKRLAEFQRKADRAYFGDDQVTYDRRPIVKAAPVTGKCPCCGSREFRTHASMRVCAYCRVAVDGQVVVNKPAFVISENQFPRSPNEFVRYRALAKITLK